MHRYTRAARSGGHAPGDLKGRRRRAKVPRERVTCERFRERADGSTDRGGRVRGLPLATAQNVAREHARDVTAESHDARHATPFAKRRALRVCFDYATHTCSHHTHATRDIRRDRRVYIYIYIYLLPVPPSVLRNRRLNFRSRHEKNTARFLLDLRHAACVSPHPATTSVSRAFPSSLLAGPTSTRDLFTNPSRSTIPAD